MEGQQIEIKDLNIGSTTPKVDKEINVPKVEREIGIPKDVTKILERGIHLWNEFRNPDGHFEEKKNEWVEEINSKITALRGDPNVPPDISIVVPTHNEERYILQLMDSISKQQTTHTFEVIIVDNNSRKEGDHKKIDGKDFLAVREDITAKLAEECGVNVIKYHEETDTDKSLKIAPIASAKQLGSERAKGNIIVVTDADSIVTPTWIETLVDPFKDTRVSLVASDVDYYRGPKLLTPAINLLNKFNRRRIFHTNPQDNLVGWSNMAFRRDDFNEFGGWNRQVPIGEDFEMLNEMRKHGKMVFADPRRATTYVSSRRMTGISFQDVIDEATGKDTRATYLTKPEEDKAHKRYFRHLVDKYLYPDENSDWKPLDSQE